MPINEPGNPDDFDHWNLLPTYSAGLTECHDAWDCVASHAASSLHLLIPGATLARLTCVSSRFHRLFTPALWGKADLTLMTLTHWQRHLASVRLAVRSLVHTWHLAQTSDSIQSSQHLVEENGPASLVSHISLLPNVQAISLPHILCDHSVLTSLPHWLFDPTHLRLLHLVDAVKATVSGLLPVILHFSALVFVDLSGTLATKHSSILYALSRLPSLRCLILRRISLRDKDMRYLLHSQPAQCPLLSHLRSLDLADNRLTSLANLLDALCSFPPSYDTPSGSVLPPTPSHPLQSYREQSDQYLEIRLYNTFTTKFVYWPLRDKSLTHPVMSLSHLRLSNNQIECLSIVSILRQCTLDVLDISMFNDTHLATVEPQAILKLQLALETYGSRLNYLRVFYGVMLTHIDPVVRQEYRINHRAHHPPAYSNSDSDANTLGLTQLKVSELSSSTTQLSIFDLATLPSLRTLVLTGLPLFTASSDLVDSICSLIRFVSQAQQRSKHSKHQFTTLRLEFSTSLTRYNPIMRPLPLGRCTLSSTEDDDSEVLWKAAQDDFSFFPGEKGVTERLEGSSQKSPASSFDTIAILSQYRRDREAEYERRCKQATLNDSPSDAGSLEVDGYWTGKIIIIRP